MFADGVKGEMRDDSTKLNLSLALFSPEVRIDQ
jgi:hypothetical protein